MDPDVLDPEVDDVDTPGTDLVPSSNLRHPAVPTTLAELAAMKGEAIEVLEARVQILETARKRAIRMTSPEDWVLFRSPDDRITGYLQDAGADRVRDITGIEVFDVSKPLRIAAADGQSFMYIITASGRCKLTGQTVEAMEGGRQSTDDFCKGKTGTDLELTVRKAARANLDGNITRELAGLKTVPLDDIVAAWEGTTKKWEHCRKGRGFGDAKERAGGKSDKEPDLALPTCEICGTTARFISGAKGGFYGCPKFSQHPDRKWSVDVEKWKKDPRSKKTDTDAPPAVGTMAGPGAQGF